MAGYDNILARSVHEVFYGLGQHGQMDLAKLATKVLIQAPWVNADVLKQSIMTLCLEKLRDSWDIRYGELMAFKAQYGHCNVPNRWIGNKSLAIWVTVQRRSYAHKTLSAQKISQLNALGFSWALRGSWQKRYQELVAYHKKTGHCDVPSTSVENKSFAAWLSVQRKRYAQGKLSVQQINQLNALGFRWKPKLILSWQQSYEQLLAFKKQMGHCNVPSSWTENNLGSWVILQRYKYRRKKLSSQQINQLNALNFQWKMIPDWKQRYAELVAFKKKYHHLKVLYSSDQYKSLSTWAHRQRLLYREVKLSQEKINCLNTLGFEWKIIASAWERRYAELVAFKKKYHHLEIPRHGEHKNLVDWTRRQRSLYRQGKLSEEKIHRLNMLGFKWSIIPDWEQRYAELVAFKKQHNHCDVSGKFNKPLSHWVKHQRQQYKLGKLEQERIAQLEKLGFNLQENTFFETCWKMRYQEFVRYREEGGKNQRLEGWVQKQRKDCKKGILSQKRIDLLNAIEFQWSANTNEN